MKHTQREIDRAEKKVQIAIDKMVSLQDMGFGSSRVTKILQELNELEADIRSTS